MDGELEIKVDLMKLNGAFIQPFTYPDGSTQDCVCVPIKGAMLYQGSRSVYVEARIYRLDEPNQYGYTHRLKQVVASDFYKQIPAERRKELIPYIGNARPSKDAGTGSGRQAAAPSPAQPGGYAIPTPASKLTPPPGSSF